VIARRVAGVGLGLAGLAAAGLVAAGRDWDALVLTATTAVGIINTLWLEVVLSRVLQPGVPRVSRSAAAVVIGRFALWVALFAVLFAVRDRVSVWAVVAGVGCFLTALAVSGSGTQSADPREE